MGRKGERDPKKGKGASVTKDVELAAVENPGVPDASRAPSARESSAWEPTEEQMVGALIAAVMDAPVDPGLDIDPEYLADLREEVAEMMARGIMIEIPSS